MEIIQKLGTLGFKQKEATAYLALLKLQKANAHQIAKEANIERTNVYNILDKLVDKGLVVKSMAGKRASYVFESPARLKELLIKQEDTLAYILPFLDALSGSKQARPAIKFYENKEGIRKVLRDSLNSQERLRRDFASVESIVDFLGLRFINNQIKERVKRGIKVRSLRCSPTGAKISERDWYLKKDNRDLLREVRHLPQLVNINLAVIIYDHIVAVISSKRESFALVIESPDFSQAMKALFDIAWEQNKKSVPNTKHA